MQRIVATHPRMMALILAVSGGVLLFAGCLAALIMNQQKVALSDLESSADRFISLRHEINSILVRLNATIPPGCDEVTLAKLRSELVHTRYVADLAVLDDQGQIVCNTTAGRLDAAVALGKPDFAGITAEGLRVRSYLGRAIPGIGSTKKTVLTSHGRFAAAPPADGIAELLGDGISAIQLAQKDGRVNTALVQPALSDEWRQLLRTPSFLQVSERLLDWQHRVFFWVKPVPGTAYIFQTVVPVDAFFASYLHLISLGACFALGVSMLAYFALCPVFLSRRKLEYRIEGLLRPGNLLCLYQPIMDLASGKPCGCEVLMRLRDGNSIIFPDVAIPAIIERNLTWRLDQMVVHVAIAELAKFLPDAVDFKVAFNFFPASVSSGNIGKMVQAALDESLHRGLKIDIEVLEQEYKDSMVEAVADLRAHNFLVSIDDFGTGFSNLANIKKVMPDFLKIDRSFVFDMEHSSIRSSLIPEIIAIGRAVGAEIVAEGIENSSQYKLLKDLGVEYGQGYLMCKPVPIEDLAAYLRGFAAEGG